MGALGETAFRRAMQSYARHDLRSRDGSDLGEPETPLLLRRAAESLGVTIDELAKHTRLPLASVESALG